MFKYDLNTILLIIVCVYLFYELNGGSFTIMNDGNVQVEDIEEIEDEDVDYSDNNSDENMAEVLDDTTNGNTQTGYDMAKFKGRNTSTNGEYKKTSYMGSQRGFTSDDDWNKPFKGKNNLSGSYQNGKASDAVKMYTGEVIPSGPFKLTAEEQQRHNNEKTQKIYDPADYFNPNELLPQEKNDDWFETLPEPLSVENRYLINVNKPIGINTVGNSLKNANLDLRAAPIIEKKTISPFMNSSFEPDFNMKPLM